MTLELLSPAFLWLLVTLPVLWLAGIAMSRGGVALRHGRRHLLLRSLLIALATLALAQPVLRRQASRLALVHLVDVSHSVSIRGLAVVADSIDEATRVLQPAESRILVFGGRDKAVASTEELRRLARSNGTPDVVSETTNIEQALAAARAEIPTGVAGRIVLYSDGRETEGDVDRSLERLSAAGIPVFVSPVRARDLGDTWIESMSLPAAAVAGAGTSVELVVGAQIEGDVGVVLSDGGTEVARAQLHAKVGLTSTTLDAVFAAPGARALTATIMAVHDAIAENNSLTIAAVVEPKPRVLYVHSASLDAGAAPAALLRAGFEVTRIAPGVLPANPALFDGWDVVVLSNVSRAELSAEAISALGSWVEQKGGGLLFAGGSAVVGESVDKAVAGYRRSEIERVLPVTFDRDDQPDVALVIVLDRSWSMNGVAMDLSKAAAEAAANTLAPDQYLGILSFANDSTWDVPLARVRETRAGWHEAIQRIMASGPTAIYPAIENAYVALSSVRARAKHVILLSDGRQDPDEFETLVRKMSAARITVSSVALGADADVELLKNIASWGGGRSYAVQDAKQIPEIFVKEAKSASSPGGENDALRPTLRHAAFFARDPGALPSITGRNMVTRKPQAVELIATNAGDPLLTMWPAGLGRTAMLSLDVDGRWSAGWIKWRGFGGLLSDMIRGLAPQRVPATALAASVVARHGTTATIEVTLNRGNATSREASSAAPYVFAERRGQERQRVQLEDVSPGRAVATLLADATEPIRLRYVDGSHRPDVTAVVAVDQAAEYRFGPPKMDTLRAIAQRTGGAFDGSVEDIRNAPVRSGLESIALAPWLLGASLALWPVEIVARRRWRRG